ncbi:MAG: LysE family translocator [Proteobacteria bacterium]|nr:LysE family translocator [Pseudomonadota bacterium]
MTYIVFTLLIGFGIGELFDAYPWLYLALKYAGSFYLLYLSYKIWMLNPKPGPDVSKPMGFKDGVILTMFNPKAHLLMILMFSQFMQPDGRPGSQMVAQIFLLTFALALVNIPNHLVWSYMGDVIARRIKSNQSDRKSNMIFSVMLISVAIYILIS